MSDNDKRSIRDILAERKQKRAADICAECGSSPLSLNPRYRNTGAQVDAALERAIEAIQEFLANEGCSCFEIGQHPCDRCIITINDARTLLRDFGIEE